MVSIVESAFFCESSPCSPKKEPDESVSNGTSSTLTDNRPRSTMYIACAMVGAHTCQWGRLARRGESGRPGT
eukprot:2164063-Prymnesium_polylepis.3